jgi:hypothetical protein
MKKFFKDIFINGSGVSSKRLNGTLGWLICSFIFIYTALTCVIGEFHILYMSLSATLLGLDSVLRVIRKDKPENKEEDKPENKE